MSEKRNVPLYLSLITLISFSLFLAIGVELAHALIIGVTTDSICKSYIENNITSNCPTNEFINTLYPGVPCNYKGSGCLEYYRQIPGHHYIIDPPSEVMSKIKMVIIRSNFDEFHLQGSAGYSAENHTLNFGLSRYVDGCKDAYISANQWIPLAGDTINYFHHDCDDDYSYILEKRHETLNKTEHNIADSYKWKLEQWQKESINKCKTTICIYGKNQSSPP